MLESIRHPAEPSAPPAPYLGGKRNLATRIVARLRAIEHDAYIEPFIGMGGIFLRRPFRVRTEIINDASRDVATLFRVLQRHYVPFMDMLRWQIASRAEFDRLRTATPETLTDLERAARFLYLQRLAFGGHVSGRSFGTSRTGPARFDISRLAEQLDQVHERLCGVTIECLSWERCVALYDRAGALFYLDPPYAGCERDYGDGMFSAGDFARMAEVLASLQGRFVMSINDTPQIRAAFGGFAIEEIETSYSVARKKGAGRVGELLITGPA